MEFFFAAARASVDLLDEQATTCVTCDGWMRDALGSRSTGIKCIA
jgi:hypothetical protein